MTTHSKDFPNTSEKSLTHRTLQGLLWMFSGAGAGAILQLIVSAILARLVSPADFGLIAAALILIKFSEIFSQLGVGPAITQHSKLDEKHISTGFTLSLLLGLGFTLLLWLLAPLVAKFFGIVDLVLVMRVLFIVFPLHSLSMVAESLLQRDLQFRWIAGISLVSYAFGYGLVGISLALMDFGVWALVGGTIAQAFIQTVMLLIVKPHTMKLRLDHSALKELMQFGSGFTLVQIFNYIALQGDNLIIGRWLGVDALGFYSRAYSLMAMSNKLFSRVLDSVLFPAMAKVQNEPQRLTTAYKQGVAIVTLTMLPGSVFLFVLAPEVISILLGPGWEDVIIPFQILVVGIVFRTSYKVSDAIARAKGVVYRHAWRQLVYAFLVLIGAWIGQHWGISGVALSIVVALLVHFLLMAQLSLSLVSLGWKNYFIACIPGIRLSLITWALVYISAIWLRQLDMSLLITFIGSSTITGGALLALLYLSPRFILGQDNLFITRVFFEQFPKKLLSLRNFNKSAKESV